MTEPHRHVWVDYEGPFRYYSPNKVCSICGEEWADA